MSDHRTRFADDTGTQSEHQENGVFDWIKSLARGRNGDANLRETLEELIEDSEGDAQSAEPINAEERLMLMNILELGELRVDDVMVPRADIVALESGTSLNDMVALFHTALHSRMPVYRKALDDVLGMVHIKDLLSFWDRREDFKLRSIIREVLFVPPAMPVLDLLLKMRATRIHMAVVVDEYGGTDGLVTIEDLVEEIVGEIEDEHDEVEGPLIVTRADGSLDADARAPIDEFENQVGVDLLPDERDEDVDTLGGFVFSLLGRVPQRGEVVSHTAGLEFEILDADPRRIKRLRVRRVSPDTLALDDDAAASD
jgi:CBS domain containing-hemolysin-like protein